MTIQFSEPVRGKRRHIFTGDQARVNRIWTNGKYQGLVERRSERDDFRFAYEQMNPDEREEDKRNPYRNRITIIDGKSATILKYISTRFAKIMFPENFVNYREIRIGKKNTNIYSDFVEDTNQATKRKREAMEKYYEEDDPNERKKIKEESDRCENKLAPSLKTTIEKVLESGIYMKHPEANYQIGADGNLIFFEVDGIDIRRALDYAYLNGQSEGMEILALLGAFIAKRMATHRTSGENAPYEKIFSESIERVFDAQVRQFENYLDEKEERYPIPFSPLRLEYYFWKEEVTRRQSRVVDKEIAKVKNEDMTKLKGEKERILDLDERVAQAI